MEVQQKNAFRVDINQDEDDMLYDSKYESNDLPKIIATQLRLTILSFLRLSSPLLKVNS